ncbi:MAG: hypothetical protein J6J66_07815 [Clostridia bacterium]|nr:hypothetical protein [Clostridia bacterium]
MLLVRLAGLTVGIKHRYGYLPKMCAGYLAPEGSEPHFTVCPTQAQLDAEGALSSPRLPDAYLESVVAYREIAERLPMYGAAVFHGAVVVLDGRAYAFTAQSGVGKTTHLSLWLKAFGERAYVLNGDKPILCVRDGTVYICGTPWRGKEGLGEGGELPLSGIGFLSRGEKNEARSATAEAVLSAFLKQVYMPKDPAALMDTLAICDRVLTSVPLLSLYCNMELDAALTAERGFRALIEKEISK